MVSYKNHKIVKPNISTNIKFQLRKKRRRRRTNNESWSLQPENLEQHIANPKKFTMPMMGRSAALVGPRKQKYGVPEFGMSYACSIARTLFVGLGIGFGLGSRKRMIHQSNRITNLRLSRHVNFYFNFGSFIRGGLFVFLVPCYALPWPQSECGYVETGQWIDKDINA